MFVQALAAYADEKLKDELNDVAFEERAVPYFLEISGDGKFLVARKRVIQVAPANGKGKPRELSQMSRVPSLPVNRNSKHKHHPLLGADDIKYVLGVGSWTDPKSANLHEARHRSFVELIDRAATETGAPELLACANFYARPDQVDAARQQLANIGAVDGSNIALYCNGAVVTDSDLVQAWWRNHYQTKSMERMSSFKAECIISGTVGNVPLTHKKIKGLKSIGGLNEMSLVSFEGDAFRSYGWDQNENSPISADRAMAYVLGLNALLKPSNNNRENFGDREKPNTLIAFIFWLRSEGEINPGKMIQETPSRPRIEAVKRIINLRRDAWLENAEPFYMAALSATGSRVILRSWLTELLPLAAENVVFWWEGLQVQPLKADTSPTTPGFPQLRYALEREGNPPASWVLALQHRALQGAQHAPLDYRILTSAIARIRAEVPKRVDGKKTPGRRLNHASMGLLRLCLNDFYQSKGQGERMPVSLEVDPPNTNRAYLCGRVLAVHDYLQWKTFDTAKENQPNSTVADRYYNLMMTSPSVAFVQVCKLGRNHLKKLRRFGEVGSKSANGLQMQIEKLLVLLGDDLPATFGIHDKARFALGFYHQKAYRPKKASSSDDSTETDTTLIPDDINDDTTPEKESAQ
jgi:CRISPR-associated protein Csd1